MNFRQDNTQIKTIFCDLDGTLIPHNWHPDDNTPMLLPGVEEFLRSLTQNRYYCVLTTARFQSECIYVLGQLRQKYNFQFNEFIYGLPTGPGVVVNDNSSEGECKAFAIAIERNKGLENITI